MSTRCVSAVLNIALAAYVMIIGVCRANEAPNEPLLRINVYMSGKLFVGEHFLGNVKEGFQYPVNDLKPGRYSVRIVGEGTTWEEMVDVAADNLATLKGGPQKVASVEPPEPTPPPVVTRPPVKPPTPAPAEEIDRSRTIPDLRLTLAHIKPGTFTMGDDEANAYEKPAHMVKLTREFWIGTTEVTADQVKAVLPKFKVSGSSGDQPVTNISWWEAMDFCNALTAREAGKLPDGYHYRLPTEAEWECCFRAGSKDRYFTGADPQQMEAYAALGRTVVNVGSKKPNAFGIYDMAGNVQEWCLDAIPSRPRAAPQTYVDGIEDPVEMKGTARVVRGGHYSTSLRGQYAAYRKPYYPTRTYRALGFRIVLAPIISEPSEGKAPRSRYK